MYFMSKTFFSSPVFVYSTNKPLDVTIRASIRQSFFYLVMSLNDPDLIAIKEKLSLGRDVEAAVDSQIGIIHLVSTQLKAKTPDMPKSISRFEQTSARMLENLQLYSTPEYIVESATKNGLDGGSSRIFLATLLHSDGTRKKVTFHFPILPPDEESKGHIAVLSYLQNIKLPFQTPQVLEYDFRENDQNPLEYPYLMLSHMPGDLLDNLYHALSLPQKLQVVEQIINIIRAMEELDFPVAGKVVSGMRLSDTMPYRQTPKTSIHIVGWSKESGPAHSLEGLISAQLEDYEMAEDCTKGSAENSGDDTNENHTEIEMPERYKMNWSRTVEYMKTLGYFIDEPIILHHSNLYPRNLLVRFLNSDGIEVPLTDPSANIKISAILDWDEPTIISRVLTREAPAWLWEMTDKISHPIEDDIPAVLEAKPENINNNSEENRTIKAFFDLEVDNALPGYLDDAYGNGQWVRWLYSRLLIGGDATKEDRERVKELERVLEATRESQVKETRIRLEADGHKAVLGKRKAKSIIDRIAEGSRWFLSKLRRPPTGS